MPFPRDGRDNVIINNMVFYAMASTCETHPRSRLYVTETEKYKHYTCLACHYVWRNSGDDRIVVTSF